MYVRAKQLCERGRRRRDLEIAADHGKVGEMTLALVSGSFELNLNDPDSSVSAPLYPILTNARLVTMHGDKMLFRGEQLVDGSWYVQEWSARLESRGQ